MSIDREEWRYGSARLLDEHDRDEVVAAGLLGGQGPRLGFVGNDTLSIAGDGPIASFAGAAGGKTRDLLSHVVANLTDQPMLIMDPRGDLSASFNHNLARTGAYGWNWNPFHILPDLIPSHRVNPLDILRLDSPTFHADTGFITSSLIPVSDHSGNGRYFEQRGQNWVSGFSKSLVERHGYMSFPSLYRLVNIIESDIERWKEHLSFMLVSRFDDVRRTASEILSKQTATSGNEFGGIIGQIYGSLSALDNPVLLASLEHADFSLSCLTDTARTHRIMLNVPPTFIKQLAPIIRTIFTVSMLFKERAPHARQVLQICDEAGQLGAFDALLRAFTYARGAGVRTWALWQDIGQIRAHFGDAGLQTFLGSAETRQFFCVRDPATAKMVSEMIGTTTITYDDLIRQDEARRQKWNAFSRLLNDDDPFEVGAEFAHFERASRNRTKQQRLVMTPDEVLSMPDDRQILFVSGRNLHPMYLGKYPYWTRREMAGRALPSPYHAPADQIRVMTQRGERWAKIVTEDVPSQLAHLPQYQSLPFRYVDGYRPI